MRKPAGSEGGGGGAGGTPCCSKVGIKRGPWTPEEDEVLASFVRKEGEGRWRTLPKRAGLLRCGKSCRLRWMNYLRPSVKRGHIAPDEEDLILRLHRLLGNRWSLIAGRIPGRTDNEIKNYWNTHLSKKLISQGIDPRTHKPFKPDDTNAKASSSSSKTAGEDHRRRVVYSDRNVPKNIKQTTQPLRDDNQALGSGGGTQTNTITQVSKEIVDLVGDDHQYHMGGATRKVSNFRSSENFPKSDGLENSNIGFRSSVVDDTNLVLGNDDDCDDDLNYCSDDVFTSFLDSLINEDAFLPPPPHQVHQAQLPNHGSIAPFSSTDPFFSANTTSTLNDWETAMRPSAFNQINESQRVDDLVLEDQSC